MGRKAIAKEKIENPMIEYTSIVRRPYLSPRKLPKVIDPTILATAPNGRPRNIATRERLPKEYGKNCVDKVLATSR